MNIVLTTFPSNKTELADKNVQSSNLADNFACELVKNRLAACVNIVQNISSVYFWDQKIEKNSECLLIIKTSEDLLEQLESYLKLNHPYKVFEFVVIKPDRVGQAYAEWVSSYISTKSQME